MATERGGVVVHTLLLIALLGVVMTEVWVDFWAGFSLDEPSTVQLRQEALSAVIGSALFLLGALTLRSFGAGGWLVVTNAVFAGIFAVLAILFFTSTGQGPDTSDAHPYRWVFWMWTVTPMAWPMWAALVVALVVRGQSLLAPRSQQDR